MATRTLYVGNLPLSATAATLEICFAEYRATNARVFAGQGFGMVEVDARHLGAALIEDGKIELLGHLLSIREVDPKGLGGYFGDRQRGYAGRNSFNMR